MVLAVLHNIMATRRRQRPTSFEYSWQVDHRGSHSGLSCCQVSDFRFFVLLRLSSYRRLVSVTSLHAGRVRFT